MSAIQRHLMIMLVQVIIYVFSRPLPIIVPTPGGLSPSLSPPSTSITNSLALVDKNTGNIVKTVPLDLLNQEHGQAFILGLHEPRREIIHQSPHSSSLPIDIPSSSSSPFHKSKSAPLQFSASAPGSPSTLVISSLNEVGAEFINKFNMSAKARKRFQNLQRAIETGRQSSLSSSTSSSPRTIRHLEKLDSLDMITTETKRVVSDVSSGVSTGIQVTSGAVGGLIKGAALLTTRVLPKTSIPIPESAKTGIKVASNVTAEATSYIRKFIRGSYGFFSDLGHQIAKTILTSATNLTDSALSFLHNKTATAALRKHIDTHGHELREIDSNGNFIPPPPPLLVSVAGGVGELGRAEKALRTLVKMGFTSYAIVGSVYDIMTTLTYASYIAYDSIMMDSKEAFLMIIRHSLGQELGDLLEDGLSVYDNLSLVYYDAMGIGEEVCVMQLEDGVVTELMAAFLQEEEEEEEEEEEKLKDKEKKEARATNTSTSFGSVSNNTSTTADSSTITTTTHAYESLSTLISSILTPTKKREKQLFVEQAEEESRQTQKYLQRQHPSSPAIIELTAF